MSLLFKTPFMVILLTRVMLEASPELVALNILAVATVLIVQPTVLAAIEVAMSGRAAARGQAAEHLPHEPIRPRRMGEALGVFVPAHGRASLRDLRLLRPVLAPWPHLGEREAMTHGPYPGRRDRAEPLADPTRA